VAGDNTKTLIRMANQIADFFGPYSPEEAVAGVQTHIAKFWSPVMRRDLGHYIDDHGGEGLRPAVLDAFTELRKPSQNGTERVAAGPSVLGEMTSDAG
jgi:formate dehydrogenase subunit delta